MVSIKKHWDRIWDGMTDGAIFFFEKSMKNVWWVKIKALSLHR
jgi:hypothetical protein